MSGPNKIYLWARFSWGGSRVWHHSVTSGLDYELCECRDHVLLFPFIMSMFANQGHSVNGVDWNNIGEKYSYVTQALGCMIDISWDLIDF